VGPDFGNLGRTDLTLATRCTAAAAAIGLVGGVLATVPASAAKPTAATTPARSDVAVTAPTGSIPFSVVDPETAPRPVVTAAIGGVPLLLLLDTGSTGIRVAADKIPSGGVTVTGPAPDYGYTSGVRLHGDQADADVAIGGYDTGPLPIEVVRSTDCYADKPDCPAAHGAKTAMFGGVADGIMGVSPEAVSGLVNPLWTLRDAAGNHVGRQFAVRYDPTDHSGSILLNVPAPGYGLAQLPESVGSRNRQSRSLMPDTEGGYDAEPYASRPAGPASPHAIIPPPDPQPSWNPRAVQTCVEGMLLPRTCVLAMFDTGTPDFALDVPGARAGTWPPGRALSMSVPAAGWNAVFTSGPGSSVMVTDSSSTTASGTLVGLPGFAEGPIRFDLDAGTVGFPLAPTPTPTPVPPATPTAAAANPAAAWLASEQYSSSEPPFHRTARKARSLPETGVPLSAALGAVTALTALLAGLGTVAAARRHPDHEG
jgi:hypothetical protein